MTIRPQHVGGEAGRIEGFRTKEQQRIDYLAQTKRFPVIEVFGPTVQGEGPDAGTACYFVRFGGCDYRCEWCDSMHAVDPATVRETAMKLTSVEILQRITGYPRSDHNPDAPLGLPGDAKLIILSGGNPALHHLDPLTRLLHRHGYRVSVETQGSVWREWLGSVDRLVVSHKPPSSGMHTPAHTAREQVFMRELEWAYGHNPERRQLVALKPVVFDDADLAYAIGLHRAYPDWPMYLSVGTDPPQDTVPTHRGIEVVPTTAEPIAETRRKVSDRYRWLAEQVALTPVLNDVRVFPQLHVLAWGHEQGR